MACDTPILIENVKEYEYIPVMCGKCPPCRKRKVDEWVFRMTEEDRNSTSSHFITLTYNTLSVPITENGYMTLLRADWTNFMKRLRKQTGYENIRFYAVGEYGEKNKRPHYHAIIFNCPTASSYGKAWSMEKLKWINHYKPLDKKGNIRDPFKNHDDKDRIPIGNVDVGQVSQRSMAYCVKYLDKKRRKRNHSREDFTPEFNAISNGIGSCYLTEKIINWHRKRPEQLYTTMRGGRRVAMSKYYRDKIWNEDYKGDRERQLEIIVEKMKEKTREERRICEKGGRNWESYQADMINSRQFKYDKYNSKSRRL